LSPNSSENSSEIIKKEYSKNNLSYNYIASEDEEDAVIEEVANKNLNAIKYLIKVGYLKENLKCHHYDQIMTLKNFRSIDGYHWSCRNSMPYRHNTSKSIKVGTFFENSKKPIYV